MGGSPRKYGFINAKLRTRISLILDEERFSQIERTATLVEAAGLLRDTPYSKVYDIYTKTGDLRQAELELIRAEIALYRDLIGITPPDLAMLINALIGRFEIENLKAGLRLWFDRHVRERDIAGERSYLITEPIRFDIPYDHILMEPDPNALVDLIQDTPYAPALRNHLTVARDSQNLFRLEVALDKLFYREVYAAIEQLSKTDGELVHRIIGTEIDLRNISWIIRSRAYPDLSQRDVESALISGGAHGKALTEGIVGDLRTNRDPLSAVRDMLEPLYPGVSILTSATEADEGRRLDLLESLLDEVMRHEARKILLSPPFSAGIILAYFILKEQEISTLITTLNGKYYSGDEDRIEELV